MLKSGRQRISQKVPILELVQEIPLHAGAKGWIGISKSR